MKEQINLIPPAAAKLRRRRILNKRVGQILRLTIVALLLLAGSLAAVFAINMIKQRQLANSINGEAITTNGTADEVKKINQTLQAMNSWTNNHTDITPLVRDILLSVPTGIKIGEISLDGPSTGLTIKGAFISRPDIITFQQQLENLPWVVRLEAPLKNFVTGSDEGFTFILYRDIQP